MEDLNSISAITKKHLIELIKGRNAHASLADALHNLPAKLRGIQPDGLPYSIWQLVYHIHMAQWDILEFSMDTSHPSPKWPDEYWPKDPGPKNGEEWDNTLEKIAADSAKFIALLEDENNNIFEPLKGEKKINLLREAMLIADHNSYHTGQIILIRRLLNAWPK